MDHDFGEWVTVLLYKAAHHIALKVYTVKSPWLSIKFDDEYGEDLGSWIVKTLSLLPI